MEHYLPNFVVLVHPVSACPDAINFALRVFKAVALTTMTYSEWLENDPIIENNLLFLRDNGELLYVKNAGEIAQLRSEVESLFEEQAILDLH